MRVSRRTWDWLPREYRVSLWEALPEWQRDFLREKIQVGRKRIVAKSAPLADRVAAYGWFHSIDLGNGVVTPGHKTLEQHAREAACLYGNVDLAGKSVIDIGACNGAYSVEAAKRGARRVTAADVWRWPTMGTRANIKLVADALALPIKARFLDIAKPLPRFMGKFDVVLFSGVFYHLKDPILGLERAASLARETLIVESHVEEIGNRPAMMFYPGDELDGDPTNWWGPNVACLIALVKDLGFRRVEASDYGNPHRAVVHAWR